jgi:hypothetical protein
VPDLFPRGRRSGNAWRLANIRGDAPRNTGSCVITLRGAHAGDWIDFGGNQGGGPISAIEAATGLEGRVRDRNGDGVGLQRTRLATDAEGGTRKAPLDTSQKMPGRVAGGAVRLAPIGDGARLALSEGIETGLAVMTACPDPPVWATLSTSGLEQAEPPPAATRIVILADTGASGAGLRAAHVAARRLRARTRRSGACSWPRTAVPGSSASRATPPGSCPTTRAGPSPPRATRRNAATCRRGAPAGCA